MRIIVASAIVPREQHPVWLYGIYANREVLTDFITVGKFYDSRLTRVMYLKIAGHMNVSQNDVETTFPVGVAKARLAQYVGRYVGEQKFDPAEANKSFVLQMDDDIAIGEALLLRMLELAEPDCGVKPWLSDLSDSAPCPLRGRYSFVSATLVPLKFYLALADDRPALEILSKIKCGGDIFFHEWYYRQVGCYFNLMTAPVLHTAMDDEYRRWKLSRAGEEGWRDKLQEDLWQAKTLEEVSNALEKHGCFSDIDRRKD